MIKNVFIFDDGLVMVWDEGGEQLPEYQGCWESMEHKIRREATPETVFMTTTWDEFLEGYMKAVDALDLGKELVGKMVCLDRHGLREIGRQRGERN